MNLRYGHYPGNICLSLEIVEAGGVVWKKKTIKIRSKHAKLDLLNKLVKQMEYKSSSLVSIL